MTKSKLKIGVVGAGSISRAVHLPGWKNIKEAEVVAIADVQEAAALKMAEDFGIPAVFQDYRKMLEMDLDAVDICTPNRLHAPITLAALEAGLSVICEKPLATSSSEVLQMGELAESRGLTLMTAQHFRFDPPTMAIKRWSGALGEVYHARVYATRRAFLPPSPGFIDSSLSGGGPCLDIGVHALDACLWVMGFPKPVRVTGTMKTNFAKGYTIPGRWGEWDRDRFDVEDFASGFVHFENGATLSFESSWLGHQEEDEDVSFQLFGKGAGVHWPSGRFSTVTDGVFCQGTVKGAIASVNPHEEELRAFTHAVLNGLPSPVPWQETLSVIRILEAIQLSSESGKEITLA